MTIKTALLSLISVLSLSACVTDPTDDLALNAHDRDEHGDVYDGLDTGGETPAIVREADAQHGDFAEDIDVASRLRERANEQASAPGSFALAK